MSSDGGRRMTSKNAMFFIVVVSGIVLTVTILFWSKNTSDGQLSPADFSPQIQEIELPERARGSHLDHVNDDSVDPKAGITNAPALHTDDFKLDEHNQDDLPDD